MTEEPKIIPFHSDLHRDITLFLSSNRHLSQNERITEVSTLIQVALMEGKLDSQALLHYAACGFLTLDAFFQHTQKFPEQLLMSLKGGKEIADRIEKEKRAKGGRAKGASKQRAKSFVHEQWGKGRTDGTLTGRYKAQFAREMLKNPRCASLESSESIKNWCIAWERGI